MRFPITLETIIKIKEVMEKKPETDFILSVVSANGVLEKIDLVYMNHDKELGVSTEAHITVDG